MMNDITAEQLHSLLDYNKDTGMFKWKQRRGNRVHRDLSAGCYCKRRKCIIIGINGKTYLAHRLAWLWVYEMWPALHIDHIDGVSTNNRISNLRDVNRSINLQNRHKAASHNKCGILGIRTVNDRWKAEIRINGKTKYLGTFGTKEEAQATYLNAKRNLHPGCTI